MHRSHPSDPKAPKVAPKITDEPIEDRAEDRRTLEIRGGVINMGFAGDEDEEPIAERETAPPPIPVADYVRAMMEHADTVEGPPSAPASSRAPPSFRGAPPPASSRAPESFRGAPRGKDAFRPAPASTGLRPFNHPESIGASRLGRALPGLPAAPAGRSPALQSEDEEFQRRPLSLRGAEPPRAPTAPDPWLDFAPQPAPDPRAGRLGGSPAGPALVGRAAATAAFQPLSSPRLTGPRAPTQPSVAKPPFVSSVASPPAPSGSKAPPVRKKSAPTMPAVTLNRPLPPPPVPKGVSYHPTPATVPRVAVGSLLAKPPPVVQPRSDAAVDAEFDSLPFDDLVAASHRASPPAAAPLAALKPVAPPPWAPPKAPVPAGLRLGKAPLSSFPPVLEVPEEDADAGDIPAILDVAWAFNPNDPDAEEEAGRRDVVLPGSSHGPGWATGPSPPRRAKADSIPPILDIGWAFSPGSYDELNEVTTAGELEDDLQPVDELQARFDEGDFAGALLLAERLLALDPTDARARGLSETARERLINAYSIELGGRRRVPHVIMEGDEIRWLALDHRAGFLLSCIDGRMSIEELLDVSCMPMLDALRILCDLRDQGVIALESFEPRSSRR